MIRAHKTRINPTPEQEQYFRKAAGTKRFVYNWGLNRWKEMKAQGVDQYGMMAAKKEFNGIKKEEYPWIAEVAKDVAEGAFRDLGTALKNYFESKKGGRKGGRVGFPKYKSRKNKKQSFHVNNDRIKIDGHMIRLPLVGWVNMAEELRFSGKIMGATVSCTAGMWFISIRVQMEKPEPKSFPCKSVGVDVGIKTLATLSDGSEFENQKPLRNLMSQLRKYSRILSRRKPNSNRWWKAQRKLERLHYRIACIRSDMLHKASHQIASTYALIGIEDLNVAGMVKNRRLSLAISDVGFGEFLCQIEYKSEFFGSRVARVGRFFASSKTCSDCGYVNQELELSHRKWSCEGCGVIHQRDWNAAKNIEQEAIRLTSA